MDDPQFGSEIGQFRSGKAGQRGTTEKGRSADARILGDIIARFCAFIVGLLVCAPVRLVAADEVSRPVVGAIRWDGWHSGDSVGNAVAKSLRPPAWRDRLPFFARVLPDGAIELRGDTPEVMTAEIAAARTARLDYWAFLAYDEGDRMNRGLELYLENSHRADVNFCLISETARWHKGNVAVLAERFAKLLAEPGYQRVAGGRPLFYFLHHQTEGIEQSWGGPAGFKQAVDALRTAATQCGLPPPYVAVMTYDVRGAKTLLDAAGLDAISAYAFQRGDDRARYGKLTGDLERFWEIQRSTKSPVIPLAMAGWDRRPRVENPVPWEHFGGTMGRYYERATAEQCAAHIGTAVQWVRSHPDACPAQAVIVYAWNEFDEGGWICPTLTEGDARVQAMGRVLREN